ncbi:uncharacterized protein MJAP1_003006 [Malassezia japonica]|uniref:holo-[acyl-carrier-protein] synthase n=1 Tax=Malassezia japonica TaxID=223818 RepID=A0AAF0F529_9BASI|nr:uncharacterized protein MJAP1_003006 [Malassezia japonica]WFD40024.1 hypothetical protein MJAP1_003006 [Malassezia japonica]
MSVDVWAVDVSAWNALPYTRVDARGARHSDEHTREFDRDAAALVQPYDPEGYAKVQQYLRAVDRVRSLIARLLPRVYCATHGIAWSEVAVRTASGGRPYLETNGTYIDYNLTHDGDWVVMAVCRHSGVRVGIDVMEVALPSFEDSSASFCRTMEQSMAPPEKQYVLAASDDAAILQRLMDVWTYKEAYTKSIGEGLGCDFQSIEVAFWEDPLQLRVRGQAIDDVQFVEIVLPPGQQGASKPSQVALALHGHGARPPWPHPSKVDAARASDNGWLHTWTYDAFLAYARDTHRP